ncbi:hypothetical protein COEREDRAFT_81243 [Coemansia reversa NRRL 1564]|uniref:Uncharacterized protein n=1 Tax=Coemansia reversa (strain ATCC 12441 / NRRL 1564) TaxID=763665 RepID=A0A2G5BC67_COERN|nr:hypothetical protein COEREDRAFT_81243 [Coemansia reversa NRRL 1564]|eukprot:PIA16592.1 hypothetical protein COEREDRAFT_81243 [Coemansia reversa NRRL 1564]
MPEDSNWSEPFEAFFRQAGLYQCLRAIQLETLIFPTKTPDDINNSLRILIARIQGYLERIKNAGLAELPSQAVAAAVDTDVVHSAASDTVLSNHSRDGRPELCVQDVIQNTMDQAQTRAKIDTFIARQQEGVGNNNQEEFLVERIGNEDTCARTDAKGVSCGVKVLKEPVQGEKNLLGKSNFPPQSSVSDSAKAVRLPVEEPLSGLEERVNNIRDHLSVEFVPESVSIHRRVAALEDRIMQLEREFPPWSAEHFNQPCRRYTQPPQSVVYRVLPLSGTTQASAPASIPTSSHVPEKRLSTPRQPKSQLVVGSRRPATPKRAKTGVHANSPLDSFGRPIFYACGRGVNSSLTRSVLAQLHSRQSTLPPTQERKTSPAAPKGEESM